MGRRKNTIKQVEKEISEEVRTDEMRVCDECKKKLGCSPVRIEFGYGSFMDGEIFEFCSDKCGIKFLTNNWVGKQMELMNKEIESKKVME